MRDRWYIRPSETPTTSAEPPNNNFARTRARVMEMESAAGGTSVRIPIRIGAAYAC